MRLNLMHDIDQCKLNLMFDLLVGNVVCVANPKDLSTNQPNKNDGGKGDYYTNRISRHEWPKLESSISDVLMLNGVLTNCDSEIFQFLPKSLNRKANDVVKIAFDSTNSNATDKLLNAIRTGFVIWLIGV